MSHNRLIFQEENNTIYSWAERGSLRALSTPISSTDKASLEEWLGRGFSSEEDGYQPPGEDVDQAELCRGRDHSHSVTFMCPVMNRE